MCLERESNPQLFRTSVLSILPSRLPDSTTLSTPTGPCWTTLLAPKCIIEFMCHLMIAMIASGNLHSLMGRGTTRKWQRVGFESHPRSDAQSACGAVMAALIIVWRLVMAQCRLGAPGVKSRLSGSRRTDDTSQPAKYCRTEKALTAW